jgi:hypothetical protein
MLCIYIFQHCERRKYFYCKTNYCVFECNKYLRFLDNTPWGWKFICRNICRSCKYILYLLIILCICWCWLKRRSEVKHAYMIYHTHLLRAFSFRSYSCHTVRKEEVTLISFFGAVWTFRAMTHIHPLPWLKSTNDCCVWRKRESCLPTPPSTALVVTWFYTNAHNSFVTLLFLVATFDSPPWNPWTNNSCLVVKHLASLNPFL